MVGGSFWPAPTLPAGKSSAPGLAVGQYVVARSLDTWICAISSELVEEDELPDGSPVLGSIAWAGFDPVSLWLLRGEDGGDGVGLHGSGTGLLDLGRVLWLIE
jgi:hypothetical protein